MQRVGNDCTIYYDFRAKMLNTIYVLLCFFFMILVCNNHIDSLWRLTRINYKAGGKRFNDIKGLGTLVGRYLVYYLF